MPESQDLILHERDRDIVVLRFNDPERRNAMTRAMGEAFEHCVAELAQDETLRAVVLTGNGSAFSAGGDMDMIAERVEEGRPRTDASRALVRDTMRSFYELFLSIRDLPCPTVAAMNGHAIGAGCCVALACDMRIVAREAKLGLNFTRLGLHPGMGASWTLPRLVGPAHAAELLYTGRIIDGEEAARIGMANRVLDASEVLEASQEVARAIAEAAPIAVRGLKRGLAHTPGASLAEQLDFEAREQSICFESEDVVEGIDAARARRSPSFEGR
jgi:enoyl-CoA hydratase